MFKLKRHPVAEAFVAGLLIATLGLLNYQTYIVNKTNPEYKLNKIVNLVDKEYKDPYDNEKFLEYMYQAGMTYFKDPYTVYFPKQDYENFNNSLNGTYNGIGIELNDCEIANVFDNTPAAKAGLQKGDKIVKVNDVEIKKSDDILNTIKDSKVDMFIIVVKRGTEEKTFEVKREKIVVPVVETQNEEVKVNKDIGYIRLKQFNHSSYVNLKKALDSYSDKKGILLDLRDNVGGYLDEAVRILQYFCSDKDVIFYEKTKYKETPYYGLNNKVDVPIVILVDGNTASAAEVVTASLRDNKNAIIIGSTTYGKGVIQSTFNFDDGSGIKITSGEWLTPKKDTINKKGIVPDYEINNFDKEIQKAEEVILSK